MNMDMRLEIAAHAAPVSGPFSLLDENAYQRWREQKLARYPQRAADLIVEVRDPRRLTAGEAQRMRSVCRAANMAIYASALSGDDDKDIVRDVARQLGLSRMAANPLGDGDGITSLRVTPGKSARGYIPYSSRRLLWHTDGYYNPPPRRIGAFILHCVQPAAEGGVNGLLDHEIAYILLRDADPEFIRALSAADAMTVPANTEGGIATRPAQTGAVFAVDAAGGGLTMRYTARTRSIEWRQDEATRAAVEFLERLFAASSPYILSHRLLGGQGLVCNNVLHCRSAFDDAAAGGPGRLLYRARYYDRVGGTTLLAQGTPQ